jgi:hypothetical protein
MAVPDVHPIRGTAGTARGAGAVRSNEWLGHNLVVITGDFLGEAYLLIA